MSIKRTLTSSRSIVILYAPAYEIEIVDSSSEFTPYTSNSKDAPENEMDEGQLMNKLKTTGIAMHFIFIFNVFDEKIRLW